MDIELEVERLFVDEVNTIINKLCLESGIISVKYNNETKYTNDDDDYEEK